MSGFGCLNPDFEKKSKKFIFDFLRLDKLMEIWSHVEAALCQPLISHVALALCQYFFS